MSIPEPPGLWIDVPPNRLGLQTADGHAAAETFHPPRIA